MNTANLQLEGVYILLTALFQALIKKSILTETELADMLSEVERNIMADRSRPAEVRGSNIEAICFPVRFLNAALRAGGDERKPCFSEIAARVGQSRND
jgi:hypothetical protein